MRLFRACTRIRSAVGAFLRSTRAAATLVSGVVVLTVTVGVGGLMANYAWQEAEWAELRAAARAAVAAAGPLLGDLVDSADEIKARVKAFAEGLMPGLSIDTDDVTVSYDADSDTTTVVVAGLYQFDDIWQDDGNDVEVEIRVDVRFEFERYELALALDVSPSMSGGTDDGVVKLTALKTAVGGVLDTLEATAEATPGSVMVALVPYASAVNVADTCNPDPQTGDCRAARSAGKERFVRMLAGVRDTVADTLSDARAAKAANTGGHWVDTFHHYGAGTSLGALRRQYLPDDLLNDRDWDLRRTDVEVDVAGLVPASFGMWTVDDEDFWNGCVMARWGAYWHTAARGPGWTQDNALNWPASMAVAAWSDAATALPATTPLHVSDAPPVATSPSTLFTAYSWPDARIVGRADGWMQDTMIELLAPGVASPNPNVRRNDWSLAENGGNFRCPRAAIVPLSDEATLLRDAVAALETVPWYYVGSRTGASGATYQGLGVVWALRTLSPLWQGVWGVDDARGAARPGVPCAAGETGCDAPLHKSIVLVSDGASFPGRTRTQLGDSRGARERPAYRVEYICWRSDEALANHRSAAQASDAASFNGHFLAPTVSSDLVDGDSRLNQHGRTEFVDAFMRFAGYDDPGNHFGYPDPPPDTQARRDAMAQTLASASGGVAPTPWELFRGVDADVVDALVGQSEFGFDGRPALIHDRCRSSVAFGPYGRADDFVYVGDTGSAGVDPEPIADVSPFAFPDERFAFLANADDQSAGTRVTDLIIDRLDEWLLEACRAAGARRVRINAVFIGSLTSFDSVGSILEDCVDAAGGDPNVAETYVVPTADELAAAFADIVTVRRNLRFLD